MAACRTPLTRIAERALFLLFAFLLSGRGLPAEEYAAANPAEERLGEQSWITFLSHRTGYNLLYRMRPDGSELEPILGGPVESAPGLAPELTLYIEPHWTRQSPDGKWYISWASDRVRPSSDWVPKFCLHLGSVEGGPTRILAGDADEEVAWSPDSKRFAYAAYLRSPEPTHSALGRVLTTQIRVRNIAMDTDGSNEIVVLEKPGVWHVSDWSPDGSRLLLRFASALSLHYGTEDLVEYDLGSALRWAEGVNPVVNWAAIPDVERYLKVLTGAQAVRHFNDGRYSPDGERVATVISRHLDPMGTGFDPKSFELAVLDRRTDRLRVLAEHPEGLRGPICWSADGREILYSRYLEADDDREKMKGALAIWAIDLSGDKSRFLTTGWSPDWR